MVGDPGDKGRTLTPCTAQPAQFIGLNSDGGERSM